MVSYYEFQITQDTINKPIYAELFSADTDYWLSTRFYGGLGFGNSSYGDLGFGINYIRGRRIDMADLFYSDVEPKSYSFQLFPIVTLKANHISGNASSGFSVNA